MKKIFLILISIFLNLSVFSQPQMAPDAGVIVGMVIDNNKAPLPYVNVFLRKTGDSSTIAAVATDQTGKFFFQDVKFDNYYLDIKLIGFQDKRINNIEISQDNRFIKIGQITIAAEDQNIGEVVIQGQTTSVQYKLDKKVVNVGDDIVAQGGNATDALRNVPSVNVDIDGNVTLRGSSNFVVMVDGKPTILEPNEALQQIPTSNIDHIEIITNPSAKYDPDGDAGIINIVTKNKSDNGLSGKIEIGLDNNLAKKGDILINYKKNKLTFVTEFNLNENIRKGSGLSYRNSIYSGYNMILDNTTVNSHAHNGMSGKVGFIYTINPKNILTVNLSASKRHFGNNSTTNQHLIYAYPTDSIDLFMTNHTEVGTGGLNYQGDINLDHKFNDKGANLKTYALLSIWNPLATNYMKIDTTDTQFNPLTTNSYQEQTIENIAKIQGRIQSDFELPFNQISKLQAGVALRYDKMNADYILQNYLYNDWVTDPTFTNNMILTMLIGSAYVTYSNSLGKLFDYQLGVRYEYTYRLADEPTTGVNYLYDKGNFYPSVHISKQLPHDQQIQASYSMRVNRPDGRVLNPFPMKMDQYTYRLGNPALEPEFANSFELNYIKQLGKNSFSIETYYKQTNGVIDHVMTLQDSIYIMQSRNLNKDWSYGGDVNLNLMLFKFINLNISGDFYKYYLWADTVKSTYTGDARFTLMTMLPTGTAVQIGGFYRAPSIDADGKMDYMIMTFAGVRQSFFKRKLQLSVNIQDPFSLLKYHIENSTSQYTSEVLMRPKSPVVGFTLTYRINNFKQDRSQQNSNQDANSMDFTGEENY